MVKIAIACRTFLLIDKEFVSFVLSRTDGMTLITKNALKDGFLRKWTLEKP